MKDIATGSQIAFSDRAGNRYNALVSSTTSQRVNLRCCVQKETTKGRDGHEANRLSILSPRHGTQTDERRLKFRWCKGPVTNRDEPGGVSPC